MDRFMLTEAFNLAEDVEEFNLGASGLNELDSFLDMAGDTSMMDDEAMIIDLEAQAEDELKQSYNGKVIINCNVCHSNIFINKEEIELDEEDNVNIDLECPYCHSIGEGYTIIGEVKPFEEEAEEEEIEDEVEEIEVEAEVEPENEVEIEEAEVEEDEENLDEALSGDRVEELGKVDELNGKLGLGRELESSDEIRGPHYTELNESLSESFVKEWWGKAQFDEDSPEKVADKYNLNVKAISKSGNEVLYKFEGAIDAFRDAMKDGYFYSVTCGLDEEHSKDLDESCHRRVEEALEEDIQAVSITTDEETMTMDTKEDGGVIIETEPVVEEEEISEEEMIAPLDTETAEEIEAEQEIEEEPEFDEESFNGLGESYLKKCYDNVNSFKTTSVELTEGVLTIEGNIGFASGNEKATKFVFEGFNANGKQRLNGCNEQISRGKKSFKLGCSVENGKVVCESLNYNYKTKNENDESVRVYGTVRKAK